MSSRKPLAGSPVMGRNYLWYRRDDAINAVLAAAG
jgi:hypothetical protein